VASEADLDVIDREAPGFAEFLAGVSPLDVETRQFREP